MLSARRQPERSRCVRSSTCNVHETADCHRARLKMPLIPLLPRCSHMFRVHFLFLKLDRPLQSHRPSGGRAYAGRAHCARHLGCTTKPASIMGNSGKIDCVIKTQGNKYDERHGLARPVYACSNPAACAFVGVFKNSYNSILLSDRSPRNQLSVT